MLLRDNNHGAEGKLMAERRLIGRRDRGRLVGGKDIDGRREDNNHKAEGRLMAEGRLIGRRESRFWVVLYRSRRLSMSRSSQASVTVKAAVEVRVKDI